MTLIKCFGVLIEGEGEGVQIAGIAVSARDRRDRETEAHTIWDALGCGELSALES